MASKKGIERTTPKANKARIQEDSKAQPIVTQKDTLHHTSTACEVLTMEDKNEKSSKKQTASDSNGGAKIGQDDNPSKLKKRRTSEGCIAASASTTPVHDRGGNGRPVLMNRCVLLYTEKIIVPPPPPPTSPPPKQTSAIKCVFIGPCEKARTAFIQSFVDRGSNDNGQKKLATSSSPTTNSPMMAPPSSSSSSSSSSSAWSMDYSKKEYSYQNSQGDSSTVLLQFYNVSCMIDTQLHNEKQQPPTVWKSLCSSFDHVVLVLSMPEQQLTDDDIKHLTRTIETWKAWMDSQCAPRSGGYPISLLLTSTPTGDQKNSCVASTSTTHPAMLIRLGAALEISRQKFGFLNWYLLDLTNRDNDIGKGADSMDEIIQSLVESTKAVMSPSVAMIPNNGTTVSISTTRTSLPTTPPPSRTRSTDSNKDVTAAAASTDAKTPDKK